MFVLMPPSHLFEVWCCHWKGRGWKDILIHNLGTPTLNNGSNWNLQWVYTVSLLTFSLECQMIALCSSAVQLSAHSLKELMFLDQWDGSTGRSSCHQAWWLEFYRLTHMVEGENFLLQVVLWTPHIHNDIHMLTHTHNKCHEIFLNF